MATYMNKLMRVMGIKEQSNEPTTIAPKYEVVDSFRTFSEKEISTFVDQVRTPSKKRAIAGDLPKLLDPLTKELQTKVLDNSRLIALAPEIDQAAAIIIPSILSPNDMRTNQFNIVIEAETEGTEVRAKIVKLLQAVFNDELKLSNKLYHWLYATKFRFGAKPLMILPSFVIPKIDEATTASIESLCTGPSLLPSVGAEVLSAAVESIGEVPSDNPVKLKDISNDNAKKLAKNLMFSTDISVLDYRKQMFDKTNDVSLETLSASLEGMGSQEEQAERLKAPFISLADLVEKNDENVDSHPSIMELPYESTIPIIIEGSPENHIGYFVLLNEYGVPITAAEDDDENSFEKERVGEVHGSKQIDDLYKAFYGSTYNTHHKKMGNELKTQVIEQVYSDYMDNLLSNELNHLGMNSFGVNMTGEITKVMFTRLMRDAKTAILFVPSHLLTYMAFEYNSNGTGRSKIDNIKFPLSLKLTLIITRLLALIESSINHRKLDITFDENIANPIETLRTIRKEIMRKKLSGISYDPNTIIKGVLDKGLTVVPNNIPGVENFNISESSNSVDYPTADDSLLQEITNMYTLSLGVSANSMNRLKEDDLAISVATNNLYMSNQIMTDQGIVAECMTKLLRTYTVHSTKLQRSIMEILNSTEIDDNKEENKGEGESSLTDKIIKDRLKNIIQGIKFTLPRPNIAFDKSQFEQLREYMSMVDEILQTIMSDEMMDRDTQDDIKRLRAFSKRDMMFNHLRNNTSFAAEFETDFMDDIPLEEIIELQQKVANFKKGSEEITRVLKPEEGGDDNSSGGRSW